MFTFLLLSGLNYSKATRVIPFAIFLLHLGFSQIDLRFQPMDWVLYRQSGSITSVSQGYSYIYIGSSRGGVFRYNIFSQDWEDPLTVAQGLPQNTIESVYFDRNTGTLWVATPDYISYSYDREGQWYTVDKTDTGMSRNSPIKHIGSSTDYVWVEAGAMFYMLDRASGVLLNALPHPDEQSITWNSGRLQYFMEFPDFLSDYTVKDGWIMLTDRFLDYYGRDIDITTIFQQDDGSLWLGTDYGYVLMADSQMEVFRPYALGLANSDVTSIVGDLPFYLAGRKSGGSRGITYFDPLRNIIDWVEPDVTINLPDVSITAGLETPQRIWFGGEGNISIYNKKRDYWKNVVTYTTGKIYTMEWDSGAVWIGGVGGVERFDETKTKQLPFGFEKAFNSIVVYDIEVVGNEVWFATDRGLFIYDKTNKRLLTGNQWSEDDKDIILICWELEPADSLIYTATSSGIYAWNRSDRTKTMIMDPTQYRNRPVKALKVVDGIIFVGTDNGLYRMHKNGTGYYHYNYSFIRHINDMYINDDECWLGTDQGLVWFNWRMDL